MDCMATPPATPAGDAPRLQVLVAEDNRVNQIFITDYLEEQGHDVDVAANGRQALDMLAQAPFDLVLMDVGMPEMDGIEATQRIRDGHDGVRNPDIPIVAFTAHALKGDRQRCLDAGMDDYLSKPVDVARLEAILQRLFSD
jgi:two-component system CheB/CheR fusion protein